MVFQFTKTWFSTSNVSKTAKQKKKNPLHHFYNFFYPSKFVCFFSNIPKKHYAKEEIKKHFYIDSFLCFDKLKLHWVLLKFTANMQSAKYFSLNGVKWQSVWKEFLIFYLWYIKDDMNKITETIKKYLQQPLSLLKYHH